MRVRRLGTRPNSIRLDHIAVSAGPTRARGFDPPREARFRLRRCDVPLAPSAGWSGLPKEPAFPADAVIAALMADPPTHLVSGTWSHPFNVDWDSPKQADSGLAFQEKQASPFSSLFACERTGALFRTHDRLRDSLACRAPHAARSAASAVSRARHPSSRPRASSPERSIRARRRGDTATTRTAYRRSRRASASSTSDLRRVAIEPQATIFFTSRA
jgi:hypothetical protein